jgi:hypothetical protein
MFFDNQGGNGATSRLTADSTNPAKTRSNKVRILLNPNSEVAADEAAR